MPRRMRRPSVFWSKVVKSDDPTTCWAWSGPHNPKGYGLYSSTLAHRVSYELSSGTLIPDTLEIDHLCRNRGCVNPTHLEPVAHEINVKRARRDRCKNGHRYVKGSHYITKDGRRQCRECTRERRGQIPRALIRGFRHAVVIHPDGGWGCRCGDWLAKDEATANELLRSHR